MDTRSSPLRTKNRAMSGVLNLCHRGVWKDYYFVLVGTTLMYAIDAKVRMDSLQSIHAIISNSDAECNG
jgi:hypothetical protein